MKGCKGCCATLDPETFPYPAMYLRSKYCSMACFRRHKRANGSRVLVTAKGAEIVGRRFRSQISADDAPAAEQINWHLDSLGYLNSTHGRLHRLLMRPPKGYVVDHINRNRLDNRRENLRVVRQAENCRNQSRHKTNKSGVPGVQWQSSQMSNGRLRWQTKPGRWRAYINVNDRQKFLGYFDTLEEATNARREGEAAACWDAYRTRLGLPSRPYPGQAW